VHWIKAEMHEFILRNWRIVKVATTKAQRKLFFNLRSNKNKLGWLSQAETEAVARDLGVAPAVVTQMEGRLSAHDMAFDGESDDDEDAWTAPSQYLESAGADPADVVARSEHASVSSNSLTAAMRLLDPRSRDILESRWLTDDKATLHELAARYDVSAERIRQLEKSALKKLKNAMQDCIVAA
jgi:RNA polymerase sigma-32 factor